MRALLASLLPHLSQRRLAGGAIVLALTQFGASLAGFFRDQAFSVVFPLHEDPVGVASLYIASFRLSDLLFQMFVMSSLSVVLVPFLATHLAENRREEMNRMTTSILALFGIVFGLAALLLAVFFPRIAPYLVHYDGEALRLYVLFGRLALLTNFLFVFGNTLGQYLIAVQRYWIYGLTPILWSLGTIMGLYLLVPAFGPLGAMYGTITGTVVYVLFRLHAVMKAGFSPALPPQGLLHPELREMGWLVLPRMAALGMLQLQLLLFDRIGSGLGSEAVAVNAFARNFQSVIIGVAGIALAQSAFSLLSQAAAKRDFPRFRSYVRKGVLLNLALTVPAAIGLAALAAVPAWLLRLQGDVRLLFMVTLAVYCISIPFESINHLLLRSFYSLKNTLIPAGGVVIAMSAGVGIAYVLAPRFGLLALPAGFTVGQIAQLLLLSAILPSAIPEKEGWMRRTWRRLRE